MKTGLKIGLYIALVALVVLLVGAFSAEHGRVLQSAPGASRSRMMAYLGCSLAAVLVLGVFAAYDIARFIGERAEEFVVQAGRPLEPSPEVQEADRLRLAGEPLEAIRVLREYLANHPRELHAMSQIAEIYNHDLKNYLAAALEYEELLKHRLPAEDWGWAALHLAKLYGRLKRMDEAVALLEKLETKYGHTTAARRARKVMGDIGGPQAEPSAGSDQADAG